MAAISMLERRIDLHMRESSDQIKLFKTDLQKLKSNSKLRSQKAPVQTAKSEKITKSKTLEVKRKFPVKPQNVSSKVQHPTHDIAEKLSVSTSQFSETDSVMSKINFNGSSSRIDCNPLKLIQFLLMDLKLKLKDFIPDDEKEITNLINEIKYATKQAYLERNVKEMKMSRKMQDQTTQVCIQNKEQLLSKDMQTDIYGSEFDLLMDFNGNLKVKSKLEANLRDVEKLFATELKETGEKFNKLSNEINLLQSKLNAEINSSEKSIESRVDLKLSEIKLEIDFLRKTIDDSKHSNLNGVHKKLAETNNKLNQVKRKCIDATKHCLQMQFDNLVHQSIIPKKIEIANELGIIKSDVRREITALKEALRQPLTTSYFTSSSSSSLSSSPRANPSSETVRDLRKEAAEILFDGRLMMEQELNGVSGSLNLNDAI